MDGLLVSLPALPLRLSRIFNRSFIIAQNGADVNPFLRFCRKKFGGGFRLRRCCSLLGGVLGSLPSSIEDVFLAFLHVVHCHLSNFGGNVEQVAQDFNKLVGGDVAGFVIVADGVGGGVLHGGYLFLLFIVPLGTVYILSYFWGFVNPFLKSFSVFFEVFFAFKNGVLRRFKAVVFCPLEYIKQSNTTALKRLFWGFIR